jgi:hypothetical protein
MAPLAWPGFAGVDDRLGGSAPRAVRPEATEAPLPPYAAHSTAPSDPTPLASSPSIPCSSPILLGTRLSQIPVQGNRVRFRSRRSGTRWMTMGRSRRSPMKTGRTGITATTAGIDCRWPTASRRAGTLWRSMRKRMPPDTLAEAARRVWRRGRNAVLALRRPMTRRIIC